MGRRVCIIIALLALLPCASCVTRRYEFKGSEYYSLQRTRIPPRVDVKEGNPTSEGAKQPNKKEDPDESFVKQFLKGCRSEKDGKLTKFYRPNYQDASKLISLLGPWKTKQTRLVSYPETNMLLITDTEEALKNIARVLRRLDCETPQVRIKVRIVELSASSDLEYGIEYTQDRSNRTSLLKRVAGNLQPKNLIDSLKPGATGFQGATFTLFTGGKHSGNIDIMIHMLQETGNAEILSCPDLLVSKDGTANLHTGQEVPFQEVRVIGTQTQYFTKFKKVGVELNVKPKFIGDSAVKLYVKPQVSSLTGWTDPSLVGGISNPMISTRSCETTVTVKSGETLVIAGLFENRKLLVRRSIPLLGDIPLLGYLFSSIRYETDKTQLLFFLTIDVVHPGRPENVPRILNPEPPQKKVPK